MKKQMQDQLAELGFTVLEGHENVYIKDGKCIRATEEENVYNIGQQDAEGNITWEADGYDAQAALTALAEEAEVEATENEKAPVTAGEEQLSHQEESDETDRATL